MNLEAPSNSEDEGWGTRRRGRSALSQQAFQEEVEVEEQEGSDGQDRREEEKSLTSMDPRWPLYNNGQEVGGWTRWDNDDAGASSDSSWGEDEEPREDGVGRRLSAPEPREDGVGRRLSAPGGRRKGGVGGGSRGGVEGDPAAITLFNTGGMTLALFYLFLMLAFLALSYIAVLLMRFRHWL